MTDEVDVVGIAGNVDYVLATGDGRIVLTGSVPASMLDAQRQVMPEGGSLVQGRASLDTDWVTGEQVRPRPANTAV
ncbi:hypothetical protein, partial [Burkholderia sp. SIMBA_048]|uniref:hypothetical protein n=1 Tax=Burkholderia sp. SIMBA_048 TaxID=3085789 RepID=UPI00397DB2C3